MEAEAGPSAGDVPARASTASVLLTRAVIAAAAVTIVLLWARVQNGPAAGDELVEESVPTTLVGGIEPAPVPGAVAEAFDLPVIGAATLTELPEEVLDGCSDSFGEIDWEEGQPEVESAIASTDAVTASLVGTGVTGPDMGFEDGTGRAPTAFRVTCSARHDGGWQTESKGLQPIFADGDVPFMDQFGGGYSCCDDNGLATATGTVAVPDGATWGLQQRSGWDLAYPVTDREQLLLSWKFREQRFGPGGPPQTQVTFVDDQGEVVGEAFTGGNS